MNTLSGTKYENILFGPMNVAKVELYFVVESVGFGTRRYQLHVFHGCPAREDWWKSDTGIVATDLSLVKAKKLIDTLVGREGAHQFFDMVSHQDPRPSKMSLLTLKDEVADAARDAA